MRVTGEKLRNSMGNLESFTYCFEIKFADNSLLLLNSSSNFIKLENKNFAPDSGLTFREGIFNDSGHNYIILEGVFEPEGITKQMDLTGAEVKILICFSDNFYHFVTYYCTIYTKHDLNFQMHLEPETIKYNKSLLNCFSNSCRANFGDNKCKVDKNLYTQEYKIAEIIGKNVTVINMDKESGYYSEGEGIFGENIFKAKILNHSGENIELDKTLGEPVNSYQTIFLIAGCNKKFITCCNKFDNAVNFRGEPLIPKTNFLKPY